MFIGRVCLPEKWNSEDSLASGTKENIEALYAYLIIYKANCIASSYLGG